MPRFLNLSLAAVLTAGAGLLVRSAPIAEDNDNATWNLYGIEYWPSFVLIDKKGVIRYEGYGEFHLNDDTYREWSWRIEALLAE